MAIQWRLKTFIAERGIYRAKDLQRKITRETGVIVSLQNICNLLKGNPQAVKLQTIEIICTALDCKMTDFCNVSPKKFDASQIRKLSFTNTPHRARGKTSFPDPKDYDQ